VVGAVIGNYQIVRMLGEGGMGVVYLGQHTLLGRRAAIKVLLPQLSARPDIVNRFFNEARAVTSISDPGIVQVFDFGYHTDGSAFIVMEYLEGEPLDRRLARLGRLPASEALRIGRQLASSLAAAHAQHIVHRDLKPENIFLVRDAEVASGERSKILDFGIAKLSDEHPGKLKTSTGMLMGTPVYMSPEQCRGLAEVDHRSDIYALGCVLFHLMTGRPPFEGEGPGDIISAHIREPAPVPSSRAPEIMPGVDALVLRCLAKAPADRFQTMVEVSAAIGQVVQRMTPGAPVSAAPAYHMLPTTVPLGGAQAMPHMLGTGVGQPSPMTPTTLGATAGQFAPAAPRSRRIGLWIAGGLVVGAAGVAIAIVGTRGADSSQVAARPAEPTLTGDSLSSGGKRDGSNGPRVVESAGSAPDELSKLSSDAPEPVAVIDAGVAVPAVGSDGRAEPPSDGGARGPHDAGVPIRERKRKTPLAKRLVTDSSAHDEPSQLSKSRSLPTKAPTSPAKRPPSKCSKAVFAAVYNAAAPSKDEVRLAIRNLNACHAAGAISDAEFDQTRDALVARF
jgi:serine/threonine-protein kinase